MMTEVEGNLWTYPADFRVITTNGSVRRDGYCVMGRGCAKEAAAKFPKLPRLLGDCIKRWGNSVFFFGDLELGSTYGLFTFPVKHVWNEPADLDLIARSVEQFKRHLLESCTYVMPRPGCGNGQRTWEEVKSLLTDLPDNVVVIDFPKGARG